MKRLFVCAAALGTIVTLSNASATDMPLKAPPLPVWSWAGFYAGGNIGYGWASDPTTLTDTTATTFTRIDDADTPNPVFIPLGTTSAAASGTGNIDPKGWLGGIQGGYNWQSRSFVYGIEGDIQISGQKGSVAICDAAGCPLGAGSANDSLKMPWFGTLRARFGFRPTPRWLVYGTGGLAVAEIKDSVTEGPVGGGAGTAWSTNMTRAGYAVGGGVEAALTNRWSIKLEYLFMGFGSISGGGAGAAATTTTGACGFCAPPRIVEQITTQTSSATSTRIDDNVVRVGLNYHFGP